MSHHAKVIAQRRYKPKECHDCGFEFEVINPAQKRCPDCQNAPRTQISIVECEGCGKLFVRKRTNKIFCSATCGHKTRRNELLYTLTCPVCGESFPVTYQQMRCGRKFCGTDCRWQGRWGNS